MSFDVRRRQSTGEDMGGHFDTYRGVVLDTADPLANDRVLVEVPDVLAAESMWARPEQPGAARPATGDAVSIRFENGDPDYPIWSADASAATAPGDSPAATEGYRATYRGIVLDNVDPGGYQRVLVEVPDVFAASSIWAMPEQPGAALPAVGDEVWVRFEDGDVDYPTWTGGSGTGSYGATCRGVVLDNVDPGGYQRVLVQLPDVPAEGPMWAMPEQADATVPEIGAEIWIRFTDGDPQHPTWSA
jgi:hypothetical protein